MTNHNADAIFHLLSDHCRRQIVGILQDMSESYVAFEELCDHLSRQNGADRDEIVIRLHHTHLPKLHEAGVIDYDPNEKLVRYLGNPHVDALLEHVSARQPHPLVDE